MNPTGRFFAKLKELALTLESETAKLQLAFENRNNDADSETTTKATRAYHELNCDVGKLKGQIQEHLAQQKAQENEVSTFIKACRVMKQRVTEDIQALRGHWEKYGYQAPPDTQRPASQESDAEGDVAEGEEESQEVAGGNGSSPLSPKVGPPPFSDMMHTPQLSDFGLSEIQLKRALAGAAWCSEAPPMPEMSLPQPSLNKNILTPMPMTPKCALRMDDDELQTPQMHEFGISEHTMCLNNDFTMDLLRKNAEKAPRPPEDIRALPVNSINQSFQAKGESMEVQELPVFLTPGLKIKKTNGHCSPPAQGNGDSESPVRPSNEPSTPQVPAFQTPYMNRLVSNKKQPKPINTQADDENHSLELPCTGLSGSKRPYSVPEVSVLGVEDMQMPELPNLESILGNSLQTRSAKMQKLKADAHEKVTEELTVNSFEQDGPTQEFSLGTPRFRADFPDPSTPLMPDLSSVTQDICKLVSQAQLKTAMAVVRPNVRTEEKNKRAVILSVVSETEFQSLPGYLRQMTLYNLNQAIHKINKFTAECSGEKTEFQMEELRDITNVGTKTPVYILCLSELNRLKHLRGSRNTSVYKLSTHN